MRDYLELGPTPTDEDCLQIGSSASDQIRECRRYKELLETLYPEHRDYDCRFKIMTFNTGTDPYREVVIIFESDDPKRQSAHYAYRVENNLPEKWDNNLILATFVRTGNFDHLKGYKYPNDPNFV